MIVDTGQLLNIIMRREQIWFSLILKRSLGLKPLKPNSLKAFVCRIYESKSYIVLKDFDSKAYN